MTVKDTTAMIAGMDPVLDASLWVYCCEPDTARAAALTPDAFTTVREAEGVTLILPLDLATAQGYDTKLPMRRITLTVFSDLEGIGLTAAVAQALTDVEVSCNVVAGFHHDHVFVPESDSTRAMGALRALQQQAAATPAPPA